MSRTIFGLRESDDGRVYIVENPRLDLLSGVIPSVVGDASHDVTEDYLEIERRRHRRSRNVKNQKAGPP